MNCGDEKMTKIKVCGLRRMEDIAYANQLLPEYIGFIFAEGRKRTVTIDEAKKLRHKLDNRIIPVGVFLNQKQEYIEECVQEGIISAIQLHGNEDDTYIEELRKKVKAFGTIPIIKAFAVVSGEDIERAKQSGADRILLDNRIPGSGKSFDWSLLAQIDRPFFLAGGLSPDNVEEALQTHPYAVDVSSGVETDKKKDFEKMKDFIQRVRNQQ